MTPIREVIEKAMKRFPTVGDTEGIVAFLSDILHARRAEIDAEWHLSSTTDESWRHLRSRRVQLSEDIQVLADVQLVLSGNPIPGKPKSKHEKPETGYGEL